MKLLHILKTEPDENTKTLVDIVSEGVETTEVNLHDKTADYDKLIDMIFEHDRVITWW